MTEKEKSLDSPLLIGHYLIILLLAIIAITIIQLLVLKDREGAIILAVIEFLTVLKFSEMVRLYKEKEQYHVQTSEN